MVFGTITGEGYINTVHKPEGKCIFNHSDSACSYAVGIGVIAFLVCVAFLVLDVYLPFMSNAQERKFAVMADLGFSGEQQTLDFSFLKNNVWFSLALGVCRSLFPTKSKFVLSSTGQVASVHCKLRSIEALYVLFLKDDICSCVSHVFACQSFLHILSFLKSLQNRPTTGKKYNQIQEQLNNF